MNERIKKLRKSLDLTQREFGERIGVKPNTIATYEIGRNQPIDAVLSLICREFSVNEKWLKYGEGEMFVNTTRSEEIAGFIGEILSEEEETFKKRFISILSKLNEDEWKLLEKMALSMTEKISNEE